MPSQLRLSPVAGIFLGCTEVFVRILLMGRKCWLIQDSVKRPGFRCAHYNLIKTVIYNIFFSVRKVARLLHSSPSVPLLAPKLNQAGSRTMKITDLECELFIEDLGQVQGGKSDYMINPPTGDVMTTLALGEESGIECGFPFDSVSDLDSRIEARLFELLEKSTPPDVKAY